MSQWRRIVFALFCQAMGEEKRMGSDRVEDRFLRGFAAGAGAGVLMNAWSYVADIMKWTTLTLSDWAGLFIFAHAPPFSQGEYAFAFLSQLVFAGALGVVFAFLLPLVGSRHHFFKGWLFSVVAWFFIYAVSTLFKVEGTVPLPLKTALGNFVASTIYGLSLPALLAALSPEGLRSPAAMAPAMRPLEEGEGAEPQGGPSTGQRRE